MSVYTHEPMGCIPKPNWPCSQVAHLIGDTEEELHDFAQQIGMQRSWFHDGGKLPHYDLTLERYQRAIAAGAETMSWRAFATRFLRRKQQQLVSKERDCD